MTDKFAGKSDEAVKKATGKNWSEWFKILDSADASKMPHKDIVLWIMDQGLMKSVGLAGHSFNEGWWTQSIVVGYEEKIGRRVWEQKLVGNFSVSVGKSLNGTPDEALKAWQKFVKGKKEFNKVKVEGDFRISSTDKWRYWKVDLADGSKLSLNIGPKGDKQSNLSVTLDKLEDKKEIEAWRKYWKEILAEL